MTPPPFELHPSLAASTHPILECPEWQLRLHRNAAVTWFILVPTTSAQDFFDLSPASQTQLAAVVRALHRFLRTELRFPKVNIAAIGNVVPQLHIHVVGRRPGDACWPQPVWGHLQDGGLEWGQAIEPLTQALTTNLVQQGLFT